MHHRPRVDRQSIFAQSTFLDQPPHRMFTGAGSTHVGYEGGLGSGVGGVDPAPGRREAVTSSTIRASAREAAVEARVGDHIVVHSTHQGEPERTGQVLEVRGESGGPPYLVKWSPDGHEGLFYPSGTCHVVRDAVHG